MERAETASGRLCPSVAEDDATDQGGGGRETRRWAQARSRIRAFGGSNAPGCIDGCRKSFLDRALPSKDADEEAFLALVCPQLSGSNTEDELWELYWCDSAMCGVYTQAGVAGQDPNVDLVISTCKNYGYSIRDPGPPPAEYSCSSLLAAEPSANPCRALPEATSSGHTGSFVESASASAASATVMPASVSASASPSAGRSSPSPGIKAAIVVGTVVAFLLLAGLVVLLLRRCPRPSSRPSSHGIRPDPRHSRHRHHLHHHPPAPLISAILRRKEGTRSISPPLTSLSPPPSPTTTAAWASRCSTPCYDVFPASPICAPTIHKLEPRWESRTAASRTRSRLVRPARLASPSPPPPPPPPPSVLPLLPWALSSRSSSSSHYGHALTTNAVEPLGRRSASTPASAFTVSPVSPALPAWPSPVRPPRPHESPLEIPDLVVPGPLRPVTALSTTTPPPRRDPPPSRALPPTPRPGSLAAPTKDSRTRLSSWDVRPLLRDSNVRPASAASSPTSVYSTDTGASVPRLHTRHSAADDGGLSPLRRVQTGHV